MPETRSPMSNAPIYDQVATEQGWSLDDLHPRFDLAYFLWDNRMKVTASRMLRNHPGAAVLRFPTARATAPDGGTGDDDA